MRFGSFRIYFLAITILLVAAGVAGAQQMPPIEPPQPMPTAHSDAPTLRVTANEVLVPTLVEKRGGGVVYGLKPQDFVLEDNGVPQKIRVQEEMDTAPVALVVAVELGGVSVLEFDKLAKLGPLLDLFLSDGRGQAALVGFDSKPHLIRDFTHSSDEVNQALKQLRPGDGGDAILDTVSYAVDLLETQPKEYRRVLLLISEERDHGSKHTKPEQLIEKIGAIRRAGAERVVLAGARRVAPRHQGQWRRPDDEYVLDAGHDCAGLQEECDQRSGPHERRRVHHLHRRQGL